MARTRKVAEIAAIEARRELLRAELAELDEQAKVAEQIAREAGRPVLIAALDRVKTPSIDKADARAIASAISNYGGKAVAVHLTSLT